MGVGAFAEPLVVVSLLVGGVYVNRNKQVTVKDGYTGHEKRSQSPYRDSTPGSVEEDSVSNGLLAASQISRSSTPSLLEGYEPVWRTRELRMFGFQKTVSTPNTGVFKNRLASRILLRCPFFIEVWYWVLIYWVYQLGRAFSALTLVEGTVNVARRHALQIIHLEQQLRIFHEVDIQTFFLARPTVMHWINRIYSYVHIPASIFFLIWLYHITTTRNRVGQAPRLSKDGELGGSPAGPGLFQARRRTMALCNLIAFVIFTSWPCMPPRLLSDKSVKGPEGKEARSYGFVDTVHGASGESSVWTQNKFCNQYAAMPSLHFGYALLIGLTVASIPLPPSNRRARGISLPFGPRIRLPSFKRLACVILGLSYSFLILVAIISTANHFILDAVAGAMVCALGWTCNELLLNLVPLEDYFFWCLRLHKPDTHGLDIQEDGVTNKAIFEDRPRYAAGRSRFRDESP